MDIILALTIIFSLSILLFFVYQLIVLNNNSCIQREQRAHDVEESKRTVREQYRNMYLKALEKKASKEEMEKLNETEFGNYVDTLKGLCESPEKEDEKA